MTNSNLPIFDVEGKYLYFLSDRDFNEVLGNIDFDFCESQDHSRFIATFAQR